MIGLNAVSSNGRNLKRLSSYNVGNTSPREMDVTVDPQQQMSRLYSEVSDSIPPESNGRAESSSWRAGELGIREDRSRVGLAYPIL
jgi:hypothetical protein